MQNTIGFIGVGMMGHGMAKNLLEKGFSVVALAHRDRTRVDSLIAKGAGEAFSPREVGERSDKTILCVTGAPEVEDVVYGEDGLLSGLAGNRVLIDCSTGEPGLVARVAADCAARGIGMADAPLARTPVEAEAGRLNAFVGAEPSVFDAIQPVLDCFCENIFHMGPVGAGTRTKLINNLITMGQAALIAEALCACAATGVDLRKFYDVISAGGGNSGIFQLIVPAILEEGSFEGMKFSLANAAKDLRYYNRMAMEIPLAGPMGPAVHDALVQAINAGHGDGLVGALVAARADLNRIDVTSGA